FIIVSAVIGTGVFTGNGNALAVAGPVGLLLNVAGVGLVAICVAETLSELNQLWTVPSAVYFYIKHFVDTEAAWVVTALYWYSYSAIFAVQMLGAANLVQYWDLAAIWPPFIFYLLVPALLLFINLNSVEIYGWIEMAFGMLKVLLIFGVTCLLFDISTKSEFRLSPQKGSVDSVYGIPHVAYSYIGIESSVVAAFESARPQSVARPSRVVHWVIFVLYFLCSLGIALTVRWDDPHLTQPLVSLSNPRSNSATIIAIAKDPRLRLTPISGFLNGCLIMSTVSAAAVSLYIAGRTLYGLSYSVSLRGGNWISAAFKGLSSVWRATNVPAIALFVSVVAFCWLPWLSEAPDGKGVAMKDVLDVLELTASMSCIITWAFLCLAFIRFRSLTKKCEGSPAETIDRLGLSKYISSEGGYGAKGIGVAFQPLPAITGFLGCLIICISASAPWWDRPARTRDVLAAYSPVSIPLPTPPPSPSRPWLR
ncbi:amino acid permease/ SLC12A domain-containing protein, partial [Schizothecium vesticola]